MNALQTIRSKIVAPKSEYNDFGNYYYRTKESILEKLKPLLIETNTWIDFRDSITLIGDAIFIVSEARLMKDGDETVYMAKGFAQHAKELKGMQPAQVTGATSSYAQKSALEALFLIDGAGTLDAMKPTASVPKTDSSRPPVASGKTPGLNWLNLGTKDYTEALTALKTGKTTLDEIKTKYRVSKATESKILAEFK